ncbi:MAG TPA: hypothetical protein VMV78_02415, partial [Thiobacillus sp.]|nr:hypothetical protein [Thiobacillus sp.]
MVVPKSLPATVIVDVAIDESGSPPLSENMSHCTESEGEPLLNKYTFILQISAVTDGWKDCATRETLSGPPNGTSSDSEVCCWSTTQLAPGDGDG